MLLVTDTIFIGNFAMVHHIYCLLSDNLTIAIQLAELVYLSHHYFYPESLPDKIIALHIFVI